MPLLLDMDLDHLLKIELEPSQFLFFHLLFYDFILAFHPQCL